VHSWAVFPWVMLESDHSHSSCANVENVWTYMSGLIHLYGMVLSKCEGKLNGLKTLFTATELY
jgi:hypothetical protein